MAYRYQFDSKEARYLSLQTDSLKGIRIIICPYERLTVLSTYIYKLGAQYIQVRFMVPH